MDSALFAENERTAPAEIVRLYAPVGDFLTEGGATIADVVVAYEEWGSRENPTILLCHALSGDSHAIGWWSRLVGPGRAIDTERFHVLCSNVLGGCQGTTGPTSSAFPAITVGDMVEVQARLLDGLGIERLHLVAGGSMGGMQAIEWSLRFPERVERVFVTASAARHSAMQIGFNEVGRQAIERDPRWCGGDYMSGEEPVDGLAIARMIGASHVSLGRGVRREVRPTAAEGREREASSRSRATFATRARSSPRASTLARS